jgi:hypothetical protein
VRGQLVSLALHEPGSVGTWGMAYNLVGKNKISLDLWFSGTLRKCSVMRTCRWTEGEASRHRKLQRPGWRPRLTCFVLSCSGKESSPHLRPTTVTTEDL